MENCPNCLSEMQDLSFRCPNCGNWIYGTPLFPRSFEPGSIAGRILRYGGTFYEIVYLVSAALFCLNLAVLTSYITSSSDEFLWAIMLIVLLLSSIITQPFTTTIVGGVVATAFGVITLYYGLVTGILHLDGPPPPVANPFSWMAFILAAYTAYRGRHKLYAEIETHRHVQEAFRRREIEEQNDEKEEN